MTEITDKIRDIRDGSPTPAEALQAISRAKAEEVESRWDNFQGKNMEGLATFQTRSGQAQIGHVRRVPNPGNLDSVEVWVGPHQGPPAFRLINPPMLVPDPQGTEVLIEKNPATGRDTVRRFRVDPLQAIAEVIASQNGSERG